MAKLIPFIAVVLALTAAASCSNERDAPPVPLPDPDWDLWNDPGLVLALDAADPLGDHLGFGLVADWSEIRGTFDDDYVYFHVDVYSSPALDNIGGVIYRLIVDSNDSTVLDEGDRVLSWNIVDGFKAEDHQGNPVIIGARFRLGPAGGLDFALERRLVNQTAFRARGETWCWQLIEFVQGDRIPNSGAWAGFYFN